MSLSSATPRTLPRRRVMWKQLDWPVVIGITGMHLLALLALLPQFFTWTGVVLCVALYWITGAWGITLGYHRLLTHRSFKTPRWFEYFLALCGCLSWQGSPMQWVGTHRLHHTHSDQEEDPHSPRHGFTWAHVLWCMHREDTWGRRGRDAAKDMARDPIMRLIDRFQLLPQLLLAVALYVGGEFAAARGYSAGGWSWVIWGIGLRTVVVYHVTWFVNSAAHTWGYRNFETPEGSTNLWWVGLLGWGEGWHNNHHAHQRSARHGMRWFELDLTWLTIRALSLVGLARDIKVPRREQLPWSKAARSASTMEPLAPPHRPLSTEGV